MLPTQVIPRTSAMVQNTLVNTTHSKPYSLMTTSSPDTVALRFSGSDKRKQGMKMTAWGALATTLFSMGGFGIYNVTGPDRVTTGAETQQDIIQDASGAADDLLIDELDLLTEEAKQRSVMYVAQAIDQEVLAFYQENDPQEVKAILTELVPQIMADADHAEVIDTILRDVQLIETPDDTQDFAAMLLLHANEFGISDADMVTYLDQVTTFSDQALQDELDRAAKNSDENSMMIIIGLLFGTVALATTAGSKKKYTDLVASEASKKEAEAEKAAKEAAENEPDIQSFDD